MGEGYTIYWSGKNEGEHHVSGVGFAIRSDLANKLKHLPQAVNDRLMTLKLELQDGTCLTIISCYAPTLNSDEADIDSFYEKLGSIVSSVSYHDRIMILGDFNARVESDNDVWNGVIGPHGIGKQILVD